MCRGACSLGGQVEETEGEEQDDRIGEELRQSINEEEDNDLRGMTACYELVTGGSGYRFVEVQRVQYTGGTWLQLMCCTLSRRMRDVP